MEKSSQLNIQIRHRLKQTLEVYIDDQSRLVTALNQKGEWVNIFEIPSFDNNQDAKLLCRTLAEYFDFMPGHQPKKSLHQLPALIWKRTDCHPQSLTFFGGSFYPWHLGHDACLKNHPRPYEILVLPDNNPWKDQKREMCVWKFFRDLCLMYKNELCSFYPGFLGTDEKNPTSIWLSKTEVPHRALLMGDDTFNGLSLWHEPEILLQNLERVYVVPRQFTESEFFEAKRKVQALKSDIIIERLDHHQYEAVSSTKLRSN